MCSRPFISCVVVTVNAGLRETGYPCIDGGLQVLTADVVLAGNKQIVGLEKLYAFVAGRIGRPMWCHEEYDRKEAHDGHDEDHGSMGVHDHQRRADCGSLAQPFVGTFGLSLLFLCKPLLLGVIVVLGVINRKGRNFYIVRLLVRLNSLANLGIQDTLCWYPVSSQMTVFIHRLVERVVDPHLLPVPD